jgi:lanthanide-dependent methanol dehydrogenase
MIQRICRSALLGGLIAASYGGTVLAQGSAAQSITSLLQDDKQWPMAAKDYANTRFSKLDQINANNVGQMKLAWTFSVGAPRGQEMAPLAIDGTIYVMVPYAGVHPNQVFALDAATGDVKWSYAPKPNQAAEGVACCDVVTRGIAYDSGARRQYRKGAVAHQAWRYQSGRDHHDGAHRGEGKGANRQ